MKRSSLPALVALCASGVSCMFIDRFDEVAADPSGMGAGGGSGASVGTSSSAGESASSGPLPCAPDTTTLCYLGPPATLGVGECASGIATCAPDGSGYGACVGQALPAFEVCATAEDENCDGLACVGAYVIDGVFGDGAAQRGTAIAARGDVVALAGVASGELAFGAGKPPSPELGDAQIPDAFLVKLDPNGKPLFRRRFADSEAAGVALVPKSGEVLLVGGAIGEVDFGGGVLPAGDEGKSDLFVARLDAKGSHVSSARYGDAGSDQRAAAVAVDDKGRAFVTGALAGALDCKNGTTLTSRGGVDALLARLDASGHLTWCRAFGDAADQEGVSVATHPSGVIVAGWFAGAIDLGSGPIMAAGATDAFVAAFDSTGAPLWSRALAAESYARATSVAVTAAGEVIVAGFFHGALDLGGQVLHTDDAHEAAFVAKLDASGTPLWSARYGDTADQRALSVAADAGGNVLVAGAFTGSLTFSPGAAPLISAGGRDGFVAKLDPSGAGVWAQSFGDGADQVSAGVCADGLGAVWATGALAGSADFGGGARSSAGASDVFVAKFSP